MAFKRSGVRFSYAPQKSRLHRLLFFVEHLRLRRFHSLKGLRPLKHPRSALRASESLYISQARFEARLAQLRDYQPDTRFSLVQMYQGEMYKTLWVKMLGKTEENSYLFSDFSEKSLSLRRKHLISY